MASFTYESLFEACENGDNEMLLSFKEKVNFNKRNPEYKTPLHLASKNGHSECVSTLLNKGANMYLRGQFKETPLHRASHEGHIACVITMLDYCIKQNRPVKSILELRDDFGWTPLHNAVSNDHVACIITLLEKEQIYQQKTT